MRYDENKCAYLGVRGVFSRKALARIRKAQGLSQEHLARVSGLATVTIAKLEEGRNFDPKASTLSKLAKALGCRLEQLFTSGSD